MSPNCDVIVIFPIFGQFGAYRKPDSGRIVCITYIFINSNFLSHKNWKQNYKISCTALTLLLWVKVPFLPKKCWFFAKKMLASAKLKGSWYWKVYFLKLNMYVNLRTKLQVSSIILTCFRWGVILPPLITSFNQIKVKYNSIKKNYQLNWCCWFSGYCFLLFLGIFLLAFLHISNILDALETWKTSPRLVLLVFRSSSNPPNNLFLHIWEPKILSNICDEAVLKKS